MSKNKAILAVIALLIIFGGIVFINKQKAAQTQNDQIKIGVMTPLSGDFGFLGEELKKGINLAASELQSKGINIETIYEDDKFSSKETVTAANKLIGVDKIDFAMMFSVSEAQPVISIFNDNKTPLVVNWDTNIFLKNAGPYIYSNGFSTEKAGENMADFAYNNLNLRNVAVISHVEPWAEIIAKSFEDQFKKNGGNIVYSNSVQVGTNDFRVEISKIKTKNPDGVYFPVIPFDSVSFLKQVKENNLKVPMMTGDVLIQAAIDAAGPAAENVYFTNAYSQNSQLSVYAASGYDALMKIGEKLNSSSDARVVLDQVFGSTRSAERLEKIYQVKNGQPIEVK